MAQEARKPAREAIERLDDLVRQLREDVDTIDDPRGQALFETGAEVLQGLRTAFAHFEARSEEAWREG